MKLDEVPKLRMKITKDVGLNGIPYSLPQSTILNGEPDIVYCYRGCFVAFFIEKYPLITKMQRNKSEQIKKNGGFSFIISTYEDYTKAKDYIERYCSMFTHCAYNENTKTT